MAHQKEREEARRLYKDIELALTQRQRLVVLTWDSARSLAFRLYGTLDMDQVMNGAEWIKIRNALKVTVGDMEEHFRNNNLTGSFLDSNPSGPAILTGVAPNVQAGGAVLQTTTPIRPTPSFARTSFSTPNPRDSVPGPGSNMLGSARISDSPPPAGHQRKLHRVPATTNMTPPQSRYPERAEFGFQSEQASLIPARDFHVRPNSRHVSRPSEVYRDDQARNREDGEDEEDSDAEEIERLRASLQDSFDGLGRLQMSSSDAVAGSNVHVNLNSSPSMVSFVPRSQHQSHSLYPGSGVAAASPSHLAPANQSLQVGREGEYALSSSIRSNRLGLHNQSPSTRTRSENHGRLGAYPRLPKLSCLREYGSPQHAVHHRSNESILEGRNHSTSLAHGSTSLPCSGTLGSIGYPEISTAAIDPLGDQNGLLFNSPRSASEITVLGSDWVANSDIDDTFTISSARSGASARH